MGRYLPWRDDPGDYRPAKRLKLEPKAESIVVTPKKEDSFREDEYMRDGLGQDDKYIMVEDELLQIAKSYTAKLHSAELSRLQDHLARRKAQKAASQSSQPKITGLISKPRQVVLQKRAHDAIIQKAATRVTALQKEEETYNSIFSSRELGRLMTSSASRLDSVLPLLPPGKAVKPATRAAAGFTKASFKKPTSSQTSPAALNRTSSKIIIEDDEEEEFSSSDGTKYNEDDEDDDDLDLIPRRQVNSNQHKPESAHVGTKTSFPAVANRIAPSKHPPTSGRTSRSYRYKRASSSSPDPTSPITNPSKSSRAPISLASSTMKPYSSSAKKKSRTNLVLSDSDEYADAEQAERWRRRRELAGAMKSGAQS
ncbi:hypothetical protein ABW20_dc0104720 [Dactylellina cionopaga]|nr:hypothetical protein ABW20_dc0104720 [Dactylellina cionopaga]